MPLPGALPRLSPADLDALAAATATAPTLSPHSTSTAVNPSSGATTAPPLSANPSAYPTKARHSPPIRVRAATHTRRLAILRATERAPAVSRRMKRVVNDAALHIAALESGALPTSRAELLTLFERRARSVFALLAEDEEARATWSAFIEADEETQTAVLRAAERAGRIRRCEGEAGDGVGGGNGGDGDGGGGGRRDAAEEAWRRVDSRIRAVFKMRAAAVRPLVEQVEESVVGLGMGESVVLRLPHALSRMVAHGVAQFHALGHRSMDVGADRVTVIRGTGIATQGAVRLVDVLA